MAEKMMLGERLAKAEKRAIDTMTRFLAIQGEKNKLAGERNALQAELAAQKTMMAAQKTAEVDSREALSTLGDGDANKAAPVLLASPVPAAESPVRLLPCAESPARMPADSPAGAGGAGGGLKEMSPQHGLGGLTPMGGDDEDEDGEELREEDILEYAQDVLGMELPADDEFLWIAEEALHQTELPSGWSEYVDANDRPYYNHPSQPQSTYEHP